MYPNGALIQMKVTTSTGALLNVVERDVVYICYAPETRGKLLATGVSYFGDKRQLRDWDNGLLSMGLIDETTY